MRMTLRAPVSTAIAVLSGVIVLVGYFVEIPILTSLRMVFLRWAFILSAVALVMGVLNMVFTHWRQMRQGQGNAFYHLAFFGGLVVTVVVAGWFGISHPFSRWIYDAVLLPVEASLMVVLAVTLTYALTRLFPIQRSGFGLVFLAVVLLALLSSAPILGKQFALLFGHDSLLNYLSRVAGVAGVRGILLGVALGSIATGLRILMGSDRPYGG
ncbi:MAG: hypothetical protein ACOY16_08720 [Chloroflexota bacterium]